ncbi:hypothetical protein EV03_0675 [Prochlorococcus marinus str. PAC1]|uniref:Uncharacterized protein n=1 Tax=Prochlorococcus marinus str. PAC1 TaxID=59924 RepID=A0A0A2C6P4_PROMR|nr:hypothetical protein EV03_0675 [Prochlorococcus marinus str. PAC1]
MSRFDCLENSSIEIILFKFPCDQVKDSAPETRTISTSK